MSGLVEEPDKRTKELIRSSDLMFLLSRCAKDLSPEVAEVSSSLAESLSSKLGENVQSPIAESSHEPLIAPVPVVISFPDRILKYVHS